MSLISQHGPCIGLTLFRFGRYKMELWYAPANYATPEHTHEESDGEFLILWALNRPIYRRVGPRTDCYIAHVPYCWRRWLSVRAGTPHGFSKGTSCMIWLCFQTWSKGSKVTSITTDFHPTT